MSKIKDILGNIDIVDGISVILCVLTAVGCGIAGFIIPPPGVIDASILQGMTILSSLAAVLRTNSTIYTAIQKHKDGNLKISNNGMNIEINKDKDGSN